MRKTKTQFKQEFGTALRESFKEPVIITDHGKDSHVLITIEEYEELISFKNEVLAAKVLPTPQQKD